MSIGFFFFYRRAWLPLVQRGLGVLVWLIIVFFLYIGRYHGSATKKKAGQGSCFLCRIVAVA